METVTLPEGRWINAPARSEVSDSCVTFTTEPGTDFWQRTYYGFQNNNAPAYVWDVDRNLTFSCSIRFDYHVLFDQAGVVVWIDENNWIKASVEYDNDVFSRLGVVVTNNGYSDWSTRNCESRGYISLRISQRGPDFLIEANEGGDWEQLRICHLAVLGETTLGMGKQKAGDVPSAPVAMGVYACSPGDSSCDVEFDNLSFSDSIWEMHH